MTAQDPAALVAALPARARQVLDLIVAGRTNAEIAVELDVTEKTIRNHSVQLFDRLGVRNRTEAAVLAVQARSAPAATRLCLQRAVHELERMERALGAQNTPLALERLNTSLRHVREVLTDLGGAP